MGVNPYDEALEELEDQQPGGNPYDATLNDLEAERTRGMRSAVIQAAPQSPDTEAKVRALSDKTGLAPAVVRARFDELQQRVAVDDTPYRQIEQETPHLAQWAQESNNAGIAKDDLEQLGALEWIVTAPQRAFARSIHHMRVAELQTQRLYRSLTQEELDTLNAEKYAAEQGGELGARGSWFRGAVTGGSELLANVLAGAYKAGPKALLGGAVGGIIGGAAGGFTTAGPGAIPGAIAGAKFGAGVGATIGGAQFGFELEAGLAYDEFTDPKWRDEFGQPMDPDVARAAALGAGALNAGLEVVGLGILARSFPGVEKLKGLAARGAIRQALKNPTVRSALKDAVLSYGETLTGETAVEVAQRAVTIMAGELGKAVDANGARARTPGEITQDLASEAAGALSGFSLLGLGGPLMSLGHNVARVQRADQAAAFFQALGEGAANSKTIQRMPEAAQQLLERATKDGPVPEIYIPTEAFRSYFQTIGDPVQAAELLTGNANALAEAEARGGDLAVKTSVYAVRLAGTPAHQALAAELRLGPDEMNAREAQAFRETVEAELEARKEEAKGSRASVVRDQIATQLEAAGIPPATAATYATLYESAFGAMAERAGVDPADLYARYGLQVQRPDVQEAAPAASAGAPAATAGLEGVPVGSAAESLLEAAAAPGDATPAPVPERPAGPWDANAAPAAAEVPGLTRAPESPDAPIDYSDPVKAAQMMRLENPNIDREAAELRRRTEASRQPAPKRDGSPATPGVESGTSSNAEDARAATDVGGAPGLQAETPTGDDLRSDAAEPVAPVDGGVQPGAGAAGRPAGSRRRPVPASQRQRVGRLIADARSRGYSGTDSELAQAFLAQFDLAVTIAADLEREANLGGWRQLLVAISEAGGIGLDDYPNDHGETLSILDALAKGDGIIRKSGRYAVKRQGQRVLPNSVGIKGAPGVVVRKGGTSWDDMRDLIATDPAFPEALRERWQDLSTFQEDVLDAALKGRAENKGEEIPGRATPSVESVLEDFLEVKEGADWWMKAGVPDPAVDFDTTEFGQNLFDDLLEPPVDTLDTGEQQPRLPGAGAVRETEVATPEFEAPFALTAPVDKSKKGKQTTLFQSSIEEEGFRQAVADFVANVKQRHPDLLELDLYVTSAGDLELDTLAVKRGAVRQGIGTAVMREITTFADMAGRRILLSPAQAGFQPVGGARTTSYARLVQFYRRFGFNRNAGRHKDFSTLKGMIRNPQPREFGQSAWHGSPHQFEQFSLQAIGTGEGAQVYGWGLYFTDTQDIAAYYRRVLTDKLLSPEEREASRVLELHKGDKEAALKSLRRRRDAYSEWIELRAALNPIIDAEPFDRAAFDAADAKLQEVYALTGEQVALPVTELAKRRDELQEVIDTLDQEREIPTGRIFKVTIPDADVMLQWDLPLSEQPAKVQAGLRAMGITWEPFKVKTLGQMRQWLNGPTAAALAREDIGIRESLGEAFRYLQEEDEVALRQWQWQHQGYFNQGRVDPTGRSLYEDLTSEIMRDPAIRALPSSLFGIVSTRDAARRASEKLAANGIVGIRYLDGSSRRAGQGGYNYVVFDDALVQVEEYFQPFFHGTPHNIVGRFSTKNIGTGEGAASFGWGLYFAENRAVAASYFDQLSDDPQILEMRLGSMRLNARNDFNYTARAHLSDVENIRAALAEDLLVEPLELLGHGEGGFRDYVLKMLDERIAEYQRSWPEGVTAGQRLRQELAKPGALSVKFEERPGGVYQVEIPDAEVAKFIDWDAPFAQQPEVVKAAAREFDPDLYDEAGADFDAEETGQWLYYRIARTLMQRAQAPLRAEADAIQARDRIDAPIGDAERARLGEIEAELNALDEGAHKAASLWFAARGVPGLRYFDQGSRADRQGTRNVVVFDDSIIKITHKDGTPLTQQERDEFFQEKEDATGARKEPERRGSIKFGPDRQTTINLFAKADLSTMLHESGHFFLEVLGDLVDQVAALENPTASQKALASDYKALLEWLGAGNRYQIDVEHHEKFARAFEVYLFEGNAPSLELRSVFSRFRAWLTGIYRSLKNLDVQLNPEVRQIFDRLLATDEALAQAAAQADIRPLFSTPESAGMSPADFELYRAKMEEANRTARERLERQLLAEVQREQQQQWKDRRAEVEAKVTADLAGAPVYRAMEAMRTGRTPDGQPLVEGDLVPLKLSKRMLVERFGADRVKALPKPYIYSVEGGLDPDAIAELYGFDSAAAMLDAIEQAVPFKRAVQQETERRMLAEHGSILLDGSLLEEAQAALSNEDREVVIRAELRALANLKRTVNPFVQAERQKGREAVAAERANTQAAQQDAAALRARARGGAAYIRGAIPDPSLLREMAQRKIRGLAIGEIKPGPYWSASRRAAQKAIELAARQDLDGAIVAKQQELINLALYREATAVLEDVDKRVRKAKSYGTPAARARFGKAGESYLDQVDGILDRYEFARVSQKVLARRASLAKFIAALEGEGLPVDLPAELLEEQRRINYRQISYEELVGVTDGLDQLAHLARLKTKLLRAKEQRELDELANEVAGSIREQARGKAPAVSRDRRPSGERKRAIADFFASHRKLASLVRELDGFQDGGAVWDAILRPLNEAGNREAEMQADATKRFSAVLERAFPTARDKQSLYEKAPIEAIGQSLSRMERIMVALNWGNEGNRDRVRRAEGWSDAQVQAILDTLSAGELSFVQEVLDLINSYWPEIAAKQQRVTGLAPEKVEGVTITAAAGTIRGGYFPLKYDDRLSASAIAALDLEAANLARQAAYAQATTKRGHTKARAEKVKLPIRRDFGVIWEHLNQVIHDLSHHETLIDVGRILGHREVQTAILETQGDIVFKQIRNTIRDVAFGDVPAIGGFERAINHVRMGATVAALGWKLSVSLMQPIGLTNSIVRIGPKWVAKGLSRWLRHPFAMSDTVEWIEESSAFMRARNRTMQREILEIRSQVGVESGTLKGWVDQAIETVGMSASRRQGIADSYFWMIQKAQQLVDVPTWLGAYEKAMAAGETEQRAIAMADQAVLDSQGGGQTKDLAGVQRGGPMMKLWTNFYSFFNVVYNQAVESRRRTRFKNPAEVGRLASDYFLLFIAPATLGFFLREAMRSGHRDEEPEEFWQRLALENAGFVAGTMLGVREVAGVLSGAAGYEGPAGARAFASLSRLGVQAKQVVEDGEDALDAAFFRSLNDVAGVLFHYPASQAWNTLAGVAALVEGKTDNPAAVVSGPPPKGSR